MQPHDPLLIKLFSFLFATFLSLAIASYALAGFTTYDRIQPIFTKTISDQLGGGPEISAAEKALAIQCKTKTSVEVPIGEERVGVKCSDLKSGAGLPSVLAKALFDKIYYNGRQCGFVACVRQELAKGVSPNLALLFVTKKAHDFYNLTVAVFIVLVTLFGVLVLRFEQTLIERLKSLGWPFLLNGVSYLYVFFRGQAGGLSKFTDPIFDLLSPIYLILLIAGVGLLAYGYYLGWKKPVSKSTA